MTDRDLPTHTEGETLDMPEGLQGFANGQVLGERYQVLDMLGRGGMGEVWRAFDLKLRVEVALKALRPEFFESERRLELLRQEVRAAREVVSPNVCRIFDLIEVEGRELVSMEYVDGATLLGVLQEGGPLELKEAQDIASQFLAGLEAIHKAGLIHRDIKPENIMLTRAGRVVVMDFGLARQEAEGGGSVSGTPAYMAPEQAAGQTLDARADVYAAGVVLAEMVSPEGIKNIQSRQSVWEGVRSEPAKLPDTPWAAVIKKAVAKDREGRYNSAHTLTRALEDVTLRVEGAEDLHPYPGLASFTEEDAEYFFGREAEVERMWRKLEGPPRMLGLVGPSGAGKTSFLRAGLIPAAGAGWTSVVCTPGSDPRAALRRAMISELEGNTEALRELAEGSDEASVSAVARWSTHHQRAMIVVDQFEELFTQNPSDEQQRFAALLGRLVLEADVFVLLSMRDDFLIHCNRHESLRSLFSELTPLDPPTGAALRRALTQPALQCGYRFEHDELVEEMLAEVEGERGALPLLAFAAARLWEDRDRETGFLTRSAYENIEGVGGALARHAEATIDHIGSERIPIVRELFRNLVTAEGTRAVREWDELLSVFEESHREPADGVLRELIDARLLTSYEVREGDEAPTRRVEIIHESLLANWPRLVRWQTQDADSAQLRDQLRQAARTWEEHERSHDLLWRGSAYREYSVWRESYPGGLTEIEEAFAEAMTSLATRRRRRRRAAATATFVVLLAVLATVGSLWRRSVAEARGAEAANLVSLAQLEPETRPSATVAYAIASLEQADSRAARMLALKALWKGPTALIASEGGVWDCLFGHDGSYIVQADISRARRPEGLLSIVHADGTRVRPENPHCEGMVCLLLSRKNDTGHTLSFNTCEDGNWEYVLWSMPEGIPLGSIRYARRFGWADAEDRQRRVVVGLKDGHASVDALAFDGTVKHIGTLELQPVSPRTLQLDSRDGRWLAVVVENELRIIEIRDDRLSEPQRLCRADRSVAALDVRGQRLVAVVDDEVLAFDIGGDLPTEPRHLGHASRVIRIAIDPLARFVATIHANNTIRLWSLTERAPPLVLEGPKGVDQMIHLNDDGSLMDAWAGVNDEWNVRIWNLSGPSPRLVRGFDVGKGYLDMDPAGNNAVEWGTDNRTLVWRTNAPVDAEPLVLLTGSEMVKRASFNPDGKWLATAGGELAVWPLAKPYPSVIRHHDQVVYDVEFAPDGSWLVSASADGTVKLWPLEGNPPPPGRTLLHLDRPNQFVAVSPDGSRILAGTGQEGVWVLRPDGQAPSHLGGFRDFVSGVAFSADGRLAAAAGGEAELAERVIRVWDVESEEEVSVLDVGEQVWPDAIAFTPDGHLLSSSESGLLRWDVKTGEREVLYKGHFRWFSASVDGHWVLMVEGTQEADDWGRGVLLDLDSGTATRLDGFGSDMSCPVLDATGTLVVTGNGDGEIAVGRVDGSEPHLLLGHKGRIWPVAIDPLGRWIASGGTDNTVRLWPMPDLSKPPLHTLPRGELIAKLKSLTNLRVVPDPESATGWKIDVGPFPGWEKVPTW
jgi:WD40 repeat protein